MARARALRAGSPGRFGTSPISCHVSSSSCRSTTNAGPRGAAVARVMSSSFRLHALQVRVLEARWVLQPVADRAIDADVGAPDERDLHGEIRVREHADQG